PEIRRRNEGEVHLEGVREQEHTVDPGPRSDIDVVEGMMPLIEIPRPFSESCRQCIRGLDSERQVDIGKRILSLRGRGPCDRGPGNTSVLSGPLEQVCANPCALLWSDIGWIVPPTEGR